MVADDQDQVSLNSLAWDKPAPAAPSSSVLDSSPPLRWPRWPSFQSLSQAGASLAIGCGRPRRVSRPSGLGVGRSGGPGVQGGAGGAGHRRVAGGASLVPRQDPQRSQCQVPWLPPRRPLWPQLAARRVSQASWAAVAARRRPWDFLPRPVPRLPGPHLWPPPASHFHPEVRDFFLL